MVASTGCEPTACSYTSPAGRWAHAAPHSLPHTAEKACQSAQTRGHTCRMLAALAEVTALLGLSKTRGFAAARTTPDGWLLPKCLCGTVCSTFLLKLHTAALTERFAILAHAAGSYPCARGGLPAPHASATGCSTAVSSDPEFHGPVLVHCVGLFFFVKKWWVSGFQILCIYFAAHVHTVF